MLTSHPRAQLSAHLDGALPPAERAAVEAHLAGCPDCVRRLAELRGAAELLAALPALVPSRRLVPRLSAVPVWLAPMRTLATLASGISVFLFMATAILANIGWLSQGAATDSLTTGAASVPQAAAPAASGAAGTPRNDTAARSPAAAEKQATSSPGAFAAATTQSPGLGGAAANADQASRESARIEVGPSPWLWLILAIVLGAIAIALQRRLRSA